MSSPQTRIKEQVQRDSASGANEVKTVANEEDLPAVYIATYSGVDVYECFIRGIPLMRRCSDDWVNSTQVLKAAKFPKAQRTRILEKEVQSGIHQKIQGGNGRFQGTWVPLDIAKKLANKHGLTDEIAPILSYTPDPKNPLQRINRTKSAATPIKRKKTNEGKDKSSVKAKRSSLNPNLTIQTQFNPLQNGGIPGNAAPNSIPQSVMTPIRYSITPQTPHNGPFSAHPMSAHPASTPNVQHTMVHNQQHMQPMHQSMGQSQQMGMQTTYKPQYIPYSNPGSASTTPQYGHFPTQGYPSRMHTMMNDPNVQPITQQMHVPNIQSQHLQHTQHTQLHHQQSQQQPQPQLQQPQPPHPQQQQQQLAMGFQQTPTHPHKHQSMPMSVGAKPSTGSLVQSKSWGSQDYDRTMRDDNDEDDGLLYSRQLIEYFSQGIEEQIPKFILDPPKNFDIDASIDSEGHSPLHWAAAMGNLKLVSILVMKGANTMTQNALGLNPLCRLVTFNNCYEKKNFGQILECLKNSLFQTDKNRRLVLHYMCQFSEYRSKLKSICYYFDIVMKEIQQQNENCNESMYKLKRAQEKLKDDDDVDIGDQKDNFMRFFLNSKDNNGDTPLHLAIRSRNEILANKLIENGADLTLANNQDEIPEEMLRTYSMQSSLALVQMLSNSQEKNVSKGVNLFNSVNENDRDVSFLSDYNKENTFIKSPGNDSTTNNRSTSISMISPIKKVNFDESIFTLNTPTSGNVFVSPLKKSQENYGRSELSNINDNFDSVMSNSIDFSKFKVDYMHSFERLENSLMKDFNSWDNQTKAGYDLLTKVKTEGSINDGNLRNILFGLMELDSTDENSQKLEILMKDKLALKQKIKDNITKKEKILISQLNLLHRLMERSQCKQIADLVMKNEVLASKRKFSVDTLDESILNMSEDKNGNGIGNYSTFDNKNGANNEDHEKLRLSIELSKLQFEREKRVNEITNKLVSHTVSRKMNNYRKLISISCGLRFESIDELIDEFAVALSN